MASPNEIIALSKKIAASLSRGESPTDLEKSDILGKKDKERLLKDVRDQSKIGEHFEPLDWLNTKNEWNTLLNKIQPSTSTLLNRYWPWGVAASIAALISISYFVLTKEPQGNDATLAGTKIEMGTDKATLTLENGSDITLEKGTTYQTENVNSNGEQLVYGTKGNAASPELAYNYLTVPRGGQFFVQLSDSTKVWLNSESKLKYPVIFNKGETRKVELVYGEAYFEVSPSSDHKGAAFKVLNPAQEIEVLGTEFNIKAYRDETHIYTTLVEGKMTVSNTSTTKMLTPDQQANLDIENNTITLRTVNVYNETSWKEGRFRFKNKPLKEIMKVLSRWYDVDVVFAQEELKNVEFTGVLNKYQNIKNILKVIENTSYINAYDIKDKKITIK